MVFGKKSKLEFNFEMNNQDDNLESLVQMIKPHLNCLVICLSHSWGGLEQVACQDSLELVKLGLTVHILCLKDSPIYQHLFHQKGINVISLGFMPRNYFDLKLRNQLLRLLDEGINCIHVHQPSLLGSIVPWMARRSKVALFVSRHIMNSHMKKDLIHRFLYNRVDSLIVMSQSLRENVLSTHPLASGSVVVIHHGLDFERFDPNHAHSEEKRSQWNVESDTIVIGVVGRIDPAKGQAIFIEAAAGLIKTRKPTEKFKFIVVGEETLGSHRNHLSELKEMVSKLRVVDDIIFTGYQDDIPAVMKALDIFVMPSREETFGLVAIEAMAMGCAVIISEGGSAEEIVGNQEFGLTVRPHDAFDLQSKIRYLLDRPDERVRMAKNAKQHVKLNYDRTQRVLKTMKLYASALQQRKNC